MQYMMVFLFILLFSSLNSINFFAGVLHAKPGEVYLGTTHYFEDYFFYLNQFFQGAHGAWFTVNRYTTEATTPSILFWPNVLLGKLGGIFGLPPHISYNLSVFLLSVAILFITYKITKNTLAFLFAATATSFMNHIWVDGKAMWYPFQLWKTPNFAFDRLGGVPHQLVQTLLFLLLVYTRFYEQKRKLLFSTALIILLTTLNPVMSGLFLAASWITGQRQIVATIVFLIVALYYNSLTNAAPHIQSKLWEASQQVATTPLFLILSIGPISILGLLGAIKAMGEKKPIMLFGIILLAMNYVLFFTDIPRLIGISNSRVLFPALYVFWGMLAAEGVYSLRKKILCIMLFFLFTIPTLYWEVKQKLVVKPQERIPLLYLPKHTYEKLISLSKQLPYDDVVLANPITHMDAIIPAFSGHTSYTGHPFATINSEQKKALAVKFFQKQMSADEAQAFLENNRIRFVLYE